MANAVIAVSDRAWDVIERYARARHQMTLKHDKANSVELIESYDELVTYIAGLEATVAALIGTAEA